MSFWYYLGKCRWISYGSSQDGHWALHSQDQRRKKCILAVLQRIPQLYPRIFLSNKLITDSKLNKASFRLHLFVDYPKRSSLNCSSMLVITIVWIHISSDLKKKMHRIFKSFVSLRSQAKVALNDCPIRLLCLKSLATMGFVYIRIALCNPLFHIESRSDCVISVSVEGKLVFNWSVIFLIQNKSGIIWMTIYPHFNARLKCFG